MIYKVDKNHIIPLTGIYNKSLFVCPSCSNNMMSKLFKNALGISHAYIGTVMVVECDVCYEHFYSHCPPENYDILKETIKERRNKHFK